MAAATKKPSFLTLSSICLTAAAAAAAALAIAILSTATAAAAEEIPTAFLATISGGQWSLLQASIGISAMHMQLLPDDTVVMFDRTDFGRSNLSLPDGKCRLDPSDLALTYDCSAHSLLYHVASNAFRPLFLRSDTWCSSGSLDPDGNLLQTGGFNDGDRAIRTFTPNCTPITSTSACDWSEPPNATLASRRWYASNQILPDGRVIVVGGRNAFTYEFLPKPKDGGGSAAAAFYLGFLKETRDPLEENNLYPFLHLLPDGNLFIFANTRSISFDYVRGLVVREFPAIPGPDKRNYPSTGSSALLPLSVAAGNGDVPAEVLVCGGAPGGAYPLATRGVYVAASQTCGRIRVTDPEPAWAMERMPVPRVISDMLLLPTGDVILINGAANGTGGWENAAGPNLNPVLYVTDEPDPTRRFVVLNPSPVARMYHSTAALLADGRILVGGSNPHRGYNFTVRPYPTELSLEAFSPHYLAAEYGRLRPSVLAVEASGGAAAVGYGEVFGVTFELASPMLLRAERGLYLYVTMVAPSFTTHSVAMNQRAVVVEVMGLDQLSVVAHRATVRAPPTPAVAPPGYYMMFVVHAGIPSAGVWVKMQR